MVIPLAHLPRLPHLDVVVATHAIVRNRRPLSAHSPLTSTSIPRAICPHYQSHLVQLHHHDSVCQNEVKKNVLWPAGAGGRHCPCRTILRPEGNAVVPLIRWAHLMCKPNTAIECPYSNHWGDLSMVSLLRATSGKGGNRLVSLVSLVCLVCLVEPDRPDRPDRPERPGCYPALRSVALAHFFSILLKRSMFGRTAGTQTLTGRS